MSSRGVLAIDQLRELPTTMKEMIRSHPNELGCLFVKDDEAYNSESFFSRAKKKFGYAIALRLLYVCLPSDDEWDDLHRNVNSFPLLVLAASDYVGDVPLDVNNQLVRRNVNEFLWS